MAGTVNGIACDVVSGSTAPLVDAVRVWRRQGFDGYGMKAGLGLARGRFNYRLVKFGDLISLQTWRDLVLGSMGQAITIVDDRGETTTGAVILQHEPPVIRRSLPYGYRAEIRISGVRRQ